MVSQDNPEDQLVLDINLEKPDIKILDKTGTDQPQETLPLKNQVAKVADRGHKTVRDRETATIAEADVDQ